MITQKTDAANRHYKALGIKNTRHTERVMIARICTAGMISCVVFALILGV